MELSEKIAILTEGAKYDVSCSSSGGKSNTVKGALGNNYTAGICHSFTSDGRCVSLLKILLSNYCEYDCAYCINKRSLDLPRARLTPKEICELTINFYKRNYIEGLFLSSAVDISPNHTMGQLCDAVEMLRTEYRFNGYIHLKAIPNCDQSLIERASQFATRMSVNLELPSEKSLKLLAPAKTKQSLLTPLHQLSSFHLNSNGGRALKPMLSAGVTTQVIVGASNESDGQIIRLAESLYKKFQLKRVYYSNYLPVTTSSLLPEIAPHPMREHRLYEADWLIRQYGFSANELGDNFPMDIDPKHNWAINNIHLFPVEINTANYEMLIRVPGIGLRNAYRIVTARQHTKLNINDLKKMRIVLSRAANFITVDGKMLPKLLPQAIKGEQLSIFDAPTAQSLILGEL